MQIETFISYNQNLGFIDVEYVGMEKSQTEGFSDILVVRHSGVESKLLWDDYNNYYSGYIVKNGKQIEWYVV